MTEPCLIQFPKMGDSSIGYISVAESLPTGALPFEVKRIFWTYHTPENIVRGRHAHHTTALVILAVAGHIMVTTEQAGDSIKTFRLENPHEGLYIPPHTWHTMQYSHTAVQLVLASHPYDEAEYIRDYQQFRSLWASR